MGGNAGARNQARAGRRRSRHRRDLLPALARDTGKADRRKGCRLFRYPAPLSRCLGPRRRPHATWRADRTAVGGLWLARTAVIARSTCDEAIHFSFAVRWIASLRSQ